jgi:hypothetical protein
MMIFHPNLATKCFLKTLGKTFLKGLAERPLGAAFPPPKPTALSRANFTPVLPRQPHLNHLRHNLPLTIPRFRTHLTPPKP